MKICPFFPRVCAKRLSEKKYSLYRRLNSFIYENFPVTGIGENSYQGYGVFSLSKAYETALEKTELRFWMGENSLNFEVYFSYPAFEKLPEIISDLSANARNGILSKQRCMGCKFACKGKRQAIFDESVFSGKVFVPCNMGGEGFAIEDEDDASSAEIVMRHIIKYTNPGSGKEKWNKNKKKK